MEGSETVCFNCGIRQCWLGHRESAHLLVQGGGKYTTGLVKQLQCVILVVGGGKFLTSSGKCRESPTLESRSDLVTSEQDNLQQ